MGGYHASWTANSELQDLILSLQQKPYKHYTWVNEQLRRKGKLVVGNNVDLRTKIIHLWHATPTKSHSRIDAST